VLGEFELETPVYTYHKFYLKISYVLSSQPEAPDKARRNYDGIVRTEFRSYRRGLRSGKEFQSHFNYPQSNLQDQKSRELLYLIH
jgi:hypothetical protein